jgi:hypothetical protein
VDWTFVYVAAGVGLNALVLGFWKPWLGAYGGEKGKNLARKEDLNEILAEVRAVTIATKEIEAKLTGEQWDRQMRWNEKRNTYTALLKAKDDLANALGPLADIIKIYEEAPGGADKQTRLNKMVAQFAKVNDAQQSFTSAYQLAVIFTNAECNTLLVTYVSGRSMATPVTVEWAQEELQNVLQHLSSLPTVAKKDLGVP